ncbi:fungal-specific transcription factor domain protein [Xylaria sp. FL0933]|nr:fungal-specific transcription factor domain protein [Xylaria sp. FL0933]
MLQEFWQSCGRTMNNATQARQQPGTACDECRKKKQRCDRRRPRCGSCERAQAVCRFKEKRVPLRQRNRSAKNRNIRLDRTERDPPPVVSAETTPEDQDATSWVNVTEVPGHSNLSLPLAPDDEHGSPSFLTPTPIHHPSPPGNIELQLSEITRVDLMQLYLDRVHPILRMLSPAKIFQSQKETDSLDQYGRCLRYAMWTIATAFSSQFEEIRNKLYSITRDMLEKLDYAGPDFDSSRIEPTQAWILLVFYELIKTNYHRAWLSAGRLFRHVQMAELYSVDRGTKPCSSSIQADPVVEEEKRRAFWLSYCVDRIISVCETTPLTLAEEVIYTRLPCPDSEFHSGIITSQCFLSEAIASRERRQYSKIAELVISTTICGRTLSHKQTSVVEKAYNSPAVDYEARRNWLEGLLDARLESLRINRPQDTLTPDPLTSFTTIFTHAAVLYLWHTANLISDNGQNRSVPSPLVARGLESAREICRLAQDIEPHGLLRAHTFTPIPLFFAAFQLRSHMEMEGSNMGHDEKAQIEEQIQTCLKLLQKLQTVNNLAGRLVHQYNMRRVPPLWL